MKCYLQPWTWTYSLELPMQQKIDTKFETLNVRSLYMPVSLKIVSRELVNFKEHLVGVQ
jgi:hypothetical protein